MNHMPKDINEYNLIQGQLDIYSSHTYLFGKSVILFPSKQLFWGLKGDDTSKHFRFFFFKLCFVMNQSYVGNYP